MKYFIKALKKYATFEGRARRKEFWWFYLFSFGIPNAFFHLAILGTFLIGSAIDSSFPHGDGFFYSVIALTAVYLLAGLFFFIPTLAVTIRRLHDIGRSGVWLVVSFIPLIGGLWLFVFLTAAGDTGRNQYGRDPKAKRKSKKRKKSAPPTTTES